jgi:hypothetical protein
MEQKAKRQSPKGEMTLTPSKEAGYAEIGRARAKGIDKLNAEGAKYK